MRKTIGMGVALAVIVAAPVTAFAGDRDCKPREACTETRHADAVRRDAEPQLRLSSTRNADLPGHYVQDDYTTGIWVNPYIVPSFR